MRNVGCGITIQIGISPAHARPLARSRNAVRVARRGRRLLVARQQGVWWRLKRSEFDARRRKGTKRAFKQIVVSGAEPGILAYGDGQPIGWCAVAPHEAYLVLDRSPTLKRVDDQPVWSITCFFVARSYRRARLTARLIEAAVQYAAAHSATIVEGYPVEPKKDNMPEFYAFTGMASAFRKAGFVEVARRSQTRPIMRYQIDPPRVRRSTKNKTYG